MLEEIKLSSILVTHQIHWKSSQASHLSFKKNSAFWHACMKYLKLMNFHKLNSICLDIAFHDSLIMKCKICSLVKIKQQISWWLSDWNLIKLCQKIHINWTDLKTIYNEFVRIMFIINCFSDMIFLYFMSMHEKEKKNLCVLKNFVS